MVSYFYSNDKNLKQDFYNRVELFASIAYRHIWRWRRILYRVGLNAKLRINLRKDFEIDARNLLAH